MKRGVRSSWLLLLAAAGLAAPAARGGIIAAVNVPVPASATSCPRQTDIALVDPATGTKSPVPGGVNSSVDDLHPSITPDGHWMTFERFDPSGGTTRIIVVDMATGQQADLFNAFQAAQIQPTTPSIKPDGSAVITGAPLASTSSSQFSAFWNVTSLASFPGGPFPTSQRAGNASFTVSGTTRTPDVRSDGVLVSGVDLNQPGGVTAHDLLLSFPGGLSSVASEGSNFIAHPTLSDPTTNVVVFQRLPAGQTRGVLAFRPVSGFSAAASVNLPALVNPSGSDELQPSFTPDGRYLGFIRFAHDGDQHDRLFVFDTATQTLLNSAGIDLGFFAFICPPGQPFLGDGGISLRETFTLLTSSITTSGLLSFQLLQSSGVGILVQRIVGHHRLFGRVVPTLKMVGRVPFGRFKRGHHHVRWNLRVGSHRLRRGTYLITPRLLTRNGIVRELGKPHVIRIR